jgi:four helix bundle protein
MNNPLLEKSMSFAIQFVSVYKALSREQAEYVMSKQILRCGTSIGANIREAQHAESKNDFIHKLNISLKEANETDYWLELLVRTCYLSESTFSPLKNDLNELKRLLVSSINTTKRNIGRDSV